MDILLDRVNKKKIYELNQNVKYLFPVDYLLFPSGHILCDSPSKENILGKVKNFSFHESLSSSVLNFNSDNIYQVYKNNKRNDIVALEINEGSHIFIHTLNESKSTSKNIIGKHSFFNNIMIQRKLELIKIWDNYIINSSFIELDEDLPRRLKKNNFQKIDVCDQTIRITRSIFPGIKEKDKLFVSIRDNDIDEKLFDALFKIEREGIDLYFKYSCIRI